MTNELRKMRDEALLLVEEKRTTAICWDPWLGGSFSSHQVPSTRLKISAEPEWDLFAPKNDLNLGAPLVFSGMNGLQFDPHIFLLL